MHYENDPNIRLEYIQKRIYLQLLYVDLIISKIHTMYLISGTIC